MNGWYAVDLDGTLAYYDKWPQDGSVGAPIPAMVERVKQMLAEGKEVRIFTARVWPMGTHSAFVLGCDSPRLKEAYEQLDKIQAWCREHLGRELPVTCVKDFAMIELFDDRATQVERNTGRLLQDELEQLRAYRDKVEAALA